MRQHEDNQESASDPKMMQAIHLEDYVKSLTDIHPCLIPRPSIKSYLSSLKLDTKPQALVHVKITHSAINHVDLLYAHGVHQNNKSGLFEPPFTLGLEFSGIVLDTYTPPTNSHQTYPFQIGDKVWGGSVGTHAEEAIFPSSAVHHLPTSCSLHDMAAFGAATIPVSYGALTFIGQLQPGETILVHAAAGGLGIYAVQIARALGAKVIATVGSEAKAQSIRDLLSPNGEIPKGEGVVNYNTSKTWEQDVLSICNQSGKDGVDLVFDTVGLIQRSIKCTTFNGRIIVAGFAGRTGTGAEKVDELEKIAVNRILLKQIKLLGYRYGETGRRMPGETEKMWRGLNELLGREPRVVRPVTYRTYQGLESINEAMTALSERKVVGKAVVEVCDEESAMKEVQRRLEARSEIAKL